MPLAEKRPVPHWILLRFIVSADIADIQIERTFVAIRNACFRINFLHQIKGVSCLKKYKYQIM